MSPHVVVLNGRSAVPALISLIASNRKYPRYSTRAHKAITAHAPEHIKIRSAVMTVGKRGRLGMLQREVSLHWTP